MYGLVNRNNSCYLDSLMVAMFSHKESPFPKHLNGNTPLKNAISSLTTSIEPVRTLLPERFHRNQHDPSEVYDLILKDFKYDPMQIRSVRTVGVADEVHKMKSIVSDIAYYTIESSSHTLKDILHPDWEQLDPNNRIKDDSNNLKYDKTRNVTRFNKADCFVFYYNRCISPFKKNTSALKLPMLLETKHGEYFCGAIIVHLGGTIHSGHYITVLYDGNEDKPTFLIYDDMKSGVQRVEYTETLEHFIQAGGVMYFYYKK